MGGIGGPDVFGKELVVQLSSAITTRTCAHRDWRWNRSVSWVRTGWEQVILSMTGGANRCLGPSVAQQPTIGP